MKKINLLLFSLLMLGCSSKVNYYHKSDIKVLEISLNDKTIDLYYSVPVETMYYSSGVDYTYNSTNKLVDVSVVRQKINTENNAMNESTLLKNTSDSRRMKEYGINSYVVKIPKQKEWSNLNEKGEIINIINQ